MKLLNPSRSDQFRTIFKISCSAQISWTSWTTGPPPGGLPGPRPLGAQSYSRCLMTRDTWHVTCDTMLPSDPVTTQRLRVLQKIRIISDKPTKVGRISLMVTCLILSLISSSIVTVMASILLSIFQVKSDHFPFTPSLIWLILVAPILIPKQPVHDVSPPAPGVGDLGGELLNIRNHSHHKESDQTLYNTW